MTLSIFKFSAAGNVFVLVDQRDLKNKAVKEKDRPRLARWLSKEFATDGVVFVSSSGAVRMVFHNPDGSRAFCGNGTRTTGFYEIRFARKKKSGEIDVVTDAGSIPVGVDRNRATLLGVNTPKHLDTLAIVNLTFYKVYSGTDHVVAFVDDVNAVDVEGVGRAVRYHKNFSPKGTNVDFVQVLSGGGLNIRTYERGVERETASCGSGVLAGASIAKALGRLRGTKARCRTRGGTLEVCFDKKGKLSLGGEVKLVFKGEAYV